MTSFVRTWDSPYEQSPPNSQKVSLGALRIRELKVDIRERLAVDHSLAGDTNDGAHKKVTLLEQAADPTTATNTAFIYSKDVSGVTEVFLKDSSGNVIQLTSSGVLLLPYVKLPEQGSDPASVANYGFLYTKDAGGITEAYYRDSGGTIQQITENGKLKIISSQNAWTAGQRVAQGSIAYAASITPDLAVSNSFLVGTLTGNITIENPSNLSAGQFFTVTFVQDGTGNRVLSYGALYKFPNGYSKLLSTAASKKDRLDCFYDGTIIQSSLAKDIST